MKIELIKLKFNDTHSYKYKLFTHCCDEIQNDKAIIFTGEDLVHSDDCWGDERYIPRFCTSHTEVITSYEDEWEQTDNYPIQFCPHCGEKIEISVVDEIDMSDKYDELTKQREELWKKCQRTDSKKEEHELRKQVRKLDDQIMTPMSWTSGKEKIRMVQKQKRVQLFENEDVLLEQRGNRYYLSLYDKEGKFQREVTIDVKDDYKVGLCNGK